MSDAAQGPRLASAQNLEATACVAPLPRAVPFAASGTLELALLPLEMPQNSARTAIAVKKMNAWWSYLL